MNSSEVHEQKHETHEHPEPEKYQLKIVYNGAVLEERFPPTEVAQAVFARAVAYFGVAGNPNLGLFFNNAQLNLQATFPSQNVPTGSTVSLQPRVVRNGAC